MDTLRDALIDACKLRIGPPLRRIVGLVGGFGCKKRRKSIRMQKEKTYADETSRLHSKKRSDYSRARSDSLWQGNPTGSFGSHSTEASDSDAGLRRPASPGINQQLASPAILRSGIASSLRFQPRRSGALISACCRS